MKLVGRVKLDEVRSRGTMRLPHPPFDVLVAWVEGEVFALEDACNHAGASLAEGWLEGKCVVCPMHGYVFDLASGALLRPKGLCSGQRRFVTKIEDEDVAIYDDFSLLVV